MRRRAAQIVKFLTEDDDEGSYKIDGGVGGKPRRRLAIWNDLKPGDEVIVMSDPAPSSEYFINKVASSSAGKSSKKYVIQSIVRQNGTEVAFYGASMNSRFAGGFDLSGDSGQIIRV